MAPLFVDKPKEQVETPKKEALKAVESIDREKPRISPPRTPLGQIEPNTAPSRPIFKSKPYETPPESGNKRKTFRSRTLGHQWLDAKEHGSRSVLFQDRKRAFATDEDIYEAPSSPPQRKKTKGGNSSLAAHIQIRSLELRTLRPSTDPSIPIEQPEWQYWNKYASISSKAVLINPRGVQLTRSSTAYALSDNVLVAEF